MKKIINEPKNLLNDLIEGFVYTHHDLVDCLDDAKVIHRKYKNEGKVALVSGGGSGHEPSHAGFVGKGMLAAAVPGEVFTSPTPDRIFEAIKVADQGAGVLLIVKNYSGDIMNFDMAKDLAEMEGITVDQVIVSDDISIEDTGTVGNRGVAGTVLVHKILGAAAENGKSLAELKELGDTLVQNIATIGVSLAPATVPEVGKPGFTLEEDELEFGVGIHGEAGYRREKIQPSYEIAKELVTQLKTHFNWKNGERFGVFVNGLGATPIMEQYIFMNDVRKLLAEDEIDVVYTKVGSYMTAIDMAGVSLTLIKIEEDEWTTLLKEPVDTPTIF